MLYGASAEWSLILTKEDRNEPHNIKQLVTQIPTFQGEQLLLYRLGGLS